MPQLRLKLLILFSLIIIFPGLSYSQSSSKREIIVAAVSAECVDTTYTAATAQSRVYPHKTVYVKEKLVYELIVTIKLTGDEFVYSKPLAITCYIPDGTSKTIIVNQELEELVPDVFYEYKMLVGTKVKGWAKITLGEWDDYNLKVHQFRGITFIDNSVYLE